MGGEKAAERRVSYSARGGQGGHLPEEVPSALRPEGRAGVSHLKSWQAVPLAEEAARAKALGRELVDVFEARPVWLEPWTGWGVGVEEPGDVSRGECMCTLGIAAGRLDFIVKVTESHG